MNSVHGSSRFLLVGLGLALLLAAGTVLADRGGYTSRSRWHGDIRSFHEHDIHRWRGGNWREGHHRGQSGWWWVVGGARYFYSVPVYPYPDPYLPPVVQSTVVVPQQAPVYIERPMVQQSAPIMEAEIPPVPVTQYWYFCRKPQGYYPYVRECRVAWQKVPATPPQ